MARLRDEVKSKFQALEVEDSFKIKEFVEEHWGKPFDEFKRRSYDVIACSVRKDFKDRTFISKNGVVIRKT